MMFQLSFALQSSPAAAVSIRVIDPERYKIVDERSGEVIEEIEECKAFFTIYEGAVYMHQGRTYLVKNLDLTSKTASCVQADLKYWTAVTDMTSVEVLGGSLVRPFLFATTGFVPNETRGAKFAPHYAAQIVPISKLRFQFLPPVVSAGVCRQNSAGSIPVHDGGMLPVLRQYAVAGIQADLAGKQRHRRLLPAVFAGCHLQVSGFPPTHKIIQLGDDYQFRDCDNLFIECKLRRRQCITFSQAIHL